MRFARVLVMLTLTSVLLTGCVGLPGDWARADAGIEALDLARVGSIVDGGHSGSGLFGEPASTMAVVEAPDAYDAVGALLLDEGYVPMVDYGGITTWDRISDGGHLLVFLAEARDGVEVDFPDAKGAITPSVDGAVVLVRWQPKRSFRPQEIDLPACAPRDPIPVEEIDDGADRIDCDEAGQVLVFPDGYSFAADQVLVAGASSGGGYPDTYSRWNLGVYGIVVAQTACDGSSTQWWGREYAVAFMKAEEGDPRPTTDRCYP